MSKKFVYAAVVSALVLTVASCGYAAKPETLGAAEPPAGERDYVPGEPAPEAAAGYAADYSTIERLIVRTGSLSLVAPDTETALDEISRVVDDLDGYVVESSTYKYQEGLQASVTLRVPAENFDTALERIRALATEVRSESISGQDVTEEYVDLQSRLHHLEATEKQLLKFMDQAEDTEAALGVYQQLQSIQGELEQTKGRIQYLEQSAAMATIDVDITPDALAQPIQIGGWHPEGTLRNAFQALVRVLQFLVDALIVIVVLVIPVLLVVIAPIAGLFFLVRAIVRRRRARKASTNYQ